MLASELRKAQELRKSMRAFGRKSSPIPKAVKTPFKFPYQSVRKEIYDTTVADTRRAAQEALIATKSMANALEAIREHGERLKEADAERAKELRRVAQSHASLKIAVDAVTAAVGVEGPQKIGKPGVDESQVTNIVREYVDGLPDKKEEFVITPEMVKSIVQMMHKLPEMDKLEVSKGIRNANSFIFNKTRYDTAELMHGGGSSSSSSGFQQPTSGAVNGINQVFTWATAPSVIVVDQGRPMQRVSSDGTVNWTGSTTTTLAVAPNYDIFAVA